MTYFQFIHNKDDVMNPTKSILLNFSYQTVTDIELIINAIVSSQKLHQLSPYQRKCVFELESPLKYFKTYSASLCMISCRMDVALKLCGCIPFFYKTSEFLLILSPCVRVNIIFFNRFRRSSHMWYWRHGMFVQCYVVRKNIWPYVRWQRVRMPSSM